MDNEDYQNIHREAWQLFCKGHFDQAIQNIDNLRQSVQETNDKFMIDRWLADLMHLSALREPPDDIAAESYAAERERIDPTAYTVLQTAMLFYWSIRNPLRTIPKAREALQKAKNERDTSTEYQCLALLGLAALDTGNLTLAEDSLNGIEQMVQTSPANRLSAGPSRP